MNIDYLKAIAKKNYNRIFECGTFMGIFSENYADDPECLIQLSLSILLDKPMFLLIAKDAKLSKKLIRLLDDYEFFTPGDMKSFEEASQRLLLKIGRWLK